MARLSRRTVLRGAGCAVALPWLESLHALAGSAAASEFPRRFGVVFLGCGVNENHWSAEGDGAAMKLSRTLAPQSAPSSPADCPEIRRAH